MASVLMLRSILCGLFPSATEQALKAELKTLKHAHTHKKNDAEMESTAFLKKTN